MSEVNFGMVFFSLDEIAVDPEVADDDESNEDVPPIPSLDQGLDFDWLNVVGMFK